MLIHSIKLVVQTSLKQQHDNPSKRIPLQLSTHSLKYFSCLLQNHHYGYTNSPKRYKLKPYAAISKVLHLLCLFWSISPCRFYLCLFRHQHAFNRKQQRSHENFVHKKTTCRQKPTAYLAAYQRLKLIKNFSILTIAASYPP